MRTRIHSTRPAVRCAWLLAGLTGLVIGNITLAQQPEQAPAQQSMEVTSFDDLVKLLSRDGINHQSNLEQKYVVTPTRKDPLNSVLVIRWAAPDGVVHFIQVMPVEIPEGRLPAIESAMIRMNHAYPVPGLGYNHEASTLYFRFTVPLLPRGKLTEQEVGEYFSYCVNQAASLLPTMEAVAKSEIDPADALAHFNARAQSQLPAGTFKREFSGSTWTLTIAADGSVALARDDQPAVESKVTLQGNVLTFQDTGGPLAVEGAGTYTFTVDGATLTFQAQNDPGQGRAQVLTSGPWTR